jgi:hypothetical protein
MMRADVRAPAADTSAVRTGQASEIAIGLGIAFLAKLTDQASLRIVAWDWRCGAMVEVTNIADIWRMGDIVCRRHALRSALALGPAPDEQDEKRHDCENAAQLKWGPND